MECKRHVQVKDTLLDDLVFDAGELLHHDVDETGDEASQKADQTTDDPAADLQTAETLQRKTHINTESIVDWELYRFNRT